MAQQFQAAPIQARTKGEVKRLRREGYVPLSLQHKGEETLHLQGEARPLDEFIRQHGESALLEVVIAPEQQRQTVLVHAIQRDPISQRLLHVTLQKVVRGEPIKTHVALLFQGEPEAVRLRTAIVQHQTERIEIRCLPKDLPEHITMDISHLAYGESLRVADLPANDRYEVLTPADTVLVSLASVAVHAAPEAEAAAPEATEATETPPAA